MLRKGTNRRYRPGQIVPKSGIYRIYHAPHRLMHEAALVEKTRFPRCKTCGNSVKFELTRAAQTKYVLPFRATFLLEEWEDQEAAAAG